MYYLAQDGKIVASVRSFSEWLEGAVNGKYKDMILLTEEEKLVYRTGWQLFWPRIKMTVINYDYEYLISEG